MNDPKSQPESYWKQRLSSEAYKVLREKETEAPFSGTLLENKDKGIYVCGGCGTELFSSDTKFDSGTGWLGFFDLVDQENVELKEDKTFGMQRTEVLCGVCGGHLGHVFADPPASRLAGGPKPTGKRYCINSVALNFRKQA